MLDAVGSKWSILIIRLLSEQPMRLNELRREMGTVSQKMLTATLRGLERDGLVRRDVTPSRPPRVDYTLTPLGHGLLQPVNALAEWALASRAQVMDARRAFDRPQTEPLGRERTER